MKQQTALGMAGGLMAAFALLQAPAQAGSLSGTASIRERIALPPDAVFEAVLIDIAIADAPARELGRVRLQPAGQSPFRFRISFNERDLTPQGSYTVRATVRQGERLLFTTDTITPVLRGGPQEAVTLQLVQVGGARRSQQSPLGTLPASWRGDLSGPGGRQRWQVDLAGDGSFQLRQTRLDRPGADPSDDIGRWRLDPASGTLLLQGGREAPVRLQPLEGGAALSRLAGIDQAGSSAANNRLLRLPRPDPIEPRLHLQGLFRYQADAASIRLCATGATLPVAMQGDYQRLERAYLNARPAGPTAPPLLVNLEGQISDQAAAEPGRGLQRTLLVERFVGVHPGQACPQTDLPAGHGATLAPPPPLRGTLWRLQSLQGQDAPSLIEAPGRPLELQLAADSDRISGSGGCNRLIGGYQLNGEHLSFSSLASTRMACSAPVMAFERRYVAGLAQVRRWSLDKRTLLLQDARGRTLLMFQPAPQELAEASLGAGAPL